MKLNDHVVCWWCFQRVDPGEHDFFGCMDRLRCRSKVNGPKVTTGQRVPEPTLFEDGA